MQLYTNLYWQTIFLEKFFAQGKNLAQYFHRILGSQSYDMVGILGREMQEHNQNTYTVKLE